jgi:hypothetical protein
MKITKLLFKKPKLFRRLHDPYRMVLINDQTLDEVASFRLTKSSVYILFSTLFVLIIAITVGILLLTPLKYYIPGYGSSKNRVEVIRLKQSVDSLADVVMAQQRMADNIHRIISGEDTGLRDTTMLSPEQIQRAAMSSILPDAEEIRKDAIGDAPKKGRGR